MYCSTRVLSLIAGYADKWGNLAGSNHPENWSILLNLLLDEWAEQGYRLSNETSGFVWDEGIDLSRSKKERDKFIAVGQAMTGIGAKPKKRAVKTQLGGPVVEHEE